jgi:hypothetical protein
MILLAAFPKDDVTYSKYTFHRTSSTSFLKLVTLECTYSLQMALLTGCQVLTDKSLFLL